MGALWLGVFVWSKYIQESTECTYSYLWLFTKLWRGLYAICFASELYLRYGYASGFSKKKVVLLKILVFFTKVLLLGICASDPLPIYYYRLFCSLKYLYFSNP